MSELLESRLVLPVNTVLDGSYRIMRVVGSGGFGITYEAEDVNLATTVAIKEYYPLDCGDRDSTMSVRPKSDRHKPTFAWGRSNFLREARTLARFEHPSIVRVSRVFEANSTAYMVMRFEQGQSFEAWLKSLGRPPAQEELDEVTAPLLDALEMMHAADILHRDIAPDNIIIRPDGTPVLLDFGAARRTVAERSHALTGIVKAGYSPQEQYTSDSRLQGPWSDIYALGGTLYRAVTGGPPEEATLRAIDDRTPSAVQSAKGSYRPRFLAAIDSCLEVDHADRPESVPRLRPLLVGRDRQPKWAAISTARSVPQRWLIAAATVVMVGGAYGGFAYARGQLTAGAKVEAGAERIAGQKATRHADGAVTEKADEEALAKARADADAKRQEEERLAAEQKKRAAEERASREAEAKRLEDAAAAKRKADRVAAPRAAFDGEWEVVGVGGERCRSKNWKYRISIENNQILVPKLAPGKVNTAGEFQYTYAAVGWQNVPPGTFSGKLSGDTGNGRYNYSDVCAGSMKLKRI